MKSLTLSIIILAYNEETYLKNCLESIARQTVTPDEVIVVDNNSTDKTVEIARSFAFVKVVHEPKQGMIPARNAGFEAATGDVLARIDADSFLRPNWVERAKLVFADSSVSAATGPALTLTIKRDWFPLTRLWSLMYFWWTEAEFGIPILWGANMAIRRSAWNQIKNDACLDDSLVHEDQDLSYLLAGQNLRVVRDNLLLMTTLEESWHSWAKFSEYTHRRNETKHLHARRATIAGTTQKLSLPQRIPRLLIVILPGILFVLTSIPRGILATALARIRRELALAE